jgi:hypothetical protein
MAGCRRDAGPSDPDDSNPIFLIPQPQVYTGQSSLVKKFVSFKMERFGLTDAASRWGESSGYGFGALMIMLGTTRGCS